MTITTATRADAAASATEVRAAHRATAGLAVTERRVIHSEWIKLRSIRSTWISFAAVAIVGVVFGAIFASAGHRRVSSQVIDPVSLSLAGFNLSRLIVGVLGVLVVSAEYSTGLIRTTLAAVTSRASVLRAKVAVFATTTIVVTGVASFIAFFVGKSLYTGPNPAALGDPGVLRAIIGNVVYCTGVGLLGIALGFLLRSTAGAIGVLFATLLLVPGLASLLPWSWSDNLTQLLPSNAGDAFASVRQQSDLLSPTVGAVVFLAWIAVMLVGAGLVLRRRDA
jgi:ABC-2 type transport system permease protein